MSDIHDEDSNSISQSSEIDELEHGYESNDTDSLNLDDDEDEHDRGRFPCLSDRIVGGSLVLHIDQTGTPVSGPIGLVSGNHTASTATSLSDTASDNMSTRAVLGDTSTAEANPLPAGDEDNSSQASIADSEADRVRRIHNSIFSSLEHDLAELVRIREETIQFLETGARSGSPARSPGSVGSSQQDNIENGNPSGSAVAVDENMNMSFPIRERLTYYTRPYTSGDIPNIPSGSSNEAETVAEVNEEATTASAAVMQAKNYKPIAKFDNAPPAKPGKPYVEVGLTSCDEKAVAARKLLDKLQYGDPEDEGACFVRRFWRETSTVVENSPNAPLTLDVAAIAQRTASLQASLEEAFDGLRLRLQQVQSSGASVGEESQDGQREGDNREGGSERNETNANGESLPNNSNDSSEYRAWDEETSIMNNPLNYDIWNELEEGNEAGPTITARINMAERRALATYRTRRISHGTTRSPANHLRTTTVGVGTNSETQQQGAELDDESTDDEEMTNYFRVRCNSIHARNRPSNVPRTLSQQDMRTLRTCTRTFCQDIGISEEMGQDLFNMFSFSEEDVQVPSNSQIQNQTPNSGEMTRSEMPLPLFPRNDSFLIDNEEDRDTDSPQPLTEPEIETASNEVGNQSSEHDDGDIPTSILGFQIVPNQEDEVSTRVYLDENYLNFPVENHEANHNEDH